MSEVRFIEEDFVRVRREPKGKSEKILTLAFGDPVEVVGTINGFTQVRVLSYSDGPFDGFVKGKLKVRDKGVLKFSMVDVQQGDGMVLETPEGKIVFIDGGDNQLFALAG